MKVKTASRAFLVCLTFGLLSLLLSACGDITTTPTATVTPEAPATPSPAPTTTAPTPTLTPPPLPSSFQPANNNDYFVKPHFGHVGYVEGVALSPDRKYLATGGDDKLVKLWDATNGKLLANLRGHLDAVKQMVFSPDSKTLATASRSISGQHTAPDYSIRLWDVPSGREIAVLRDSKKSIGISRFVADGNLLVSTFYEGDIVFLTLWDVKTQQVVQEVNFPSTLYIISDDGKLLARREISDNPQSKTEILVTELSTDKVITKLPFGKPYNYLLDLTFTPDNRKIAGVFGAHYNNDATFQVWDIASGTLVSEEEQKTGGMLRDLAVSSDSKTILASGSYIARPATLNPYNGVPLDISMVTDQTGPTAALIKHFDLATGKVLNTWRTPEDKAIFAYFGADGKTPFALTQRYGNFYLRDLAADKIVATFEKAQPVTALAYSPDGKWLASGQADGKIYLRNVSDGQIVAKLEGHTERIMTLAFSPDSRRLASGSRDSRDFSARLWEISPNGTASRELANLNAHKAWITSLAFSPDGSKLATGSTDTNIKIWQLSSVNAQHQSTPTEIASFKAHGLGVWSLAFSPDGKSIFSGGQAYYGVKEPVVRQWDATTGQPGTLQLNISDFKEVRQLALSPDGKKIAVQDALGKLIVFDTTNSKELYTLVKTPLLQPSVYPELPNVLSLLVFSNSGKTLFSTTAFPGGLKGNSDSEVKVWEIGDQSGREILSLNVGSRNVASLTVNPQTQSIAAGYDDNALKIWSAQSHTQLSYPVVPTVTPQGQKTLPTPLPVTTLVANSAPVTKVSLKEVYNSPPTAGHTNYVKRLFYLPDGKSLISADSLSVKLWETATGKEIRAWSAYWGIISVSPDGKLLATSALPNEIKLWEIASGKEIRTLKGHGDPVLALAFSPDSKTLVSASTRYQSDRDKSIRIWQVSDGKQLVRIPSGSVSHIAFHPDGKSFAAASYNDGTDYDVNIYDLSGKLIAEPGKRISQVQSLTYSPDGQTLFANDYLGWVRRWNVAAGYQSIKEYNLKMYVGKAVYTADSKRLITGDTSSTKEKKIRIYAADGTGEQKSFPTFTDGISALALSPDERFVAVGSEMPSAPDRREVHIYELATGKEVGVFRGSWGVSAPLWVARDGSSYYARTADEQLALYETITGKTLATVKIPSLDKWEAPRITPDGKMVVVLNSMDKGLRLYDLPSGKQVGNFFSLAYPGSPTIRPDGRIVAIAEVVHNTMEVRQLDLRPGTQNGDSNANLAEYAPLKFPPLGKYLQPTLAYNADGSLLMMLTREPDKTATNSVQPKIIYYVSLLEIATGRKLVEFSPGEKYKIKVILSQDGKTIATSDNENIKLWDATTGKLRTELKGHLNDVRSLVFSPDGRVLISAADDGRVIFWETATGKLLHSASLSETVSNLNLSPDGRRLFANFNGSRMQIWDLTLS